MIPAHVESESPITKQNSDTPDHEQTSTVEGKSLEAGRHRPTLVQIMLRPRWIGALILAIAVAAGFAWLGNWQLESALVNQTVEQDITENVVELAQITEPSIPVSEKAGGRRVIVKGSFVPEDFDTVGNRENFGKNGYWVVGHFVTDSAVPANLSVAIGWAESEKQADLAAEALQVLPASTVTLEGRYQPTEGPVAPDVEADPFLVRSMDPAQQANLWITLNGPTFNGFLVSHEATGGLDQIDSQPPLPPQSVNWLNIFYAAEWVVFAGFAIYFWYRLTRDTFEKEIDLLAQDDQTNG